MAVYFDQNGNLVDTNISESSDVLPPNPFLSPDTADSPYANLVGLPANQDMGYLLGVPETSNAGYLQGVPQTADDQGYLQGVPQTVDDQGYLLSVPDTSDTGFPFAPQNRLQGLDLNRFEGVGSLGIANEDDPEQELLSGQEEKSGGITDLLKALIGFAVPGSSFFLNKGRGAMEGIKSLNQRLRNTDFAKSSSLADYFDARSYGGRDARDRAAEKTMREAKAIQKQVDMRPSSIQTNQDRARGNYSAPSRPSRASSYRDSSSFGKSFHG